MQSTRAQAVADAQHSIESGELEHILKRRIAHRTQSQAPGNRAAQQRYFLEDVGPELTELGFVAMVLENVVSADHPLFVARRIEDESLPTLLLYGHSDVQFAHEANWSEGLHPWELTRAGERLYGRGTADNKGQHTVNLLALRSVLRSRPVLGYNVTVLLESGEETGSIGLEETVAANRELLAADLFIGSDGPRYTRTDPTVFLGSRGCAAFVLECDLREEDAHSGNWGGRLRNPATMIAAAISALVDGRGVIQVPELLPAGEIPAAVREAIAALPPSQALADPGWGAPGLTPDERVFAWNTLEVIALDAGQPAAPVSSIPGAAWAHLHLRYVTGTDVGRAFQAMRARLDELGLADVKILAGSDVPASRLSPDAPVVRTVVESVARTTGRTPAVLPNIGGTIPNAVFAETLGLPTLWIPHSYPDSAQHAPDEHALLPVLQEGLAIIAGVLWDIAESPESWMPRGGGGVDDSSLRRIA
ncbi:M20/M25/M40 family metallo-hydrolase [Agromyces sp. NPDC060279]|uniref:M20/M25/M40 family metallo-hydrolase n=1 Tax=Agromyces sp. NPDC060279 TaxID=3347092 RepID=UPI0036479DDA